jgi:hypothetical protein
MINPDIEHGQGLLSWTEHPIHRMNIDQFLQFILDLINNRPNHDVIVYLEEADREHLRVLFNQIKQSSQEILNMRLPECSKSSTDGMVDFLLLTDNGTITISITISYLDNTKFRIEVFLPISSIQTLLKDKIPIKDVLKLVLGFLPPQKIAVKITRIYPTCFDSFLTYTDCCIGYTMVCIAQNLWMFCWVYFIAFFFVYKAKNPKIFF